MMTKQEILDMFQDCDFSCLAEENCFSKVIKNLPEEYQESAKIDSGISKLVISLPNEDFVIKIPFQGYYDEDEAEAYDEEFDEWYTEETTGFFTFDGAQDDQDGSDYCRAEELIFLEIEGYDNDENTEISKMFAKTERIGFVNNYPIYIQPKCETFFDTDDVLYDQKTSEKVSSFCRENFHSCFNLAWLCNVVEKYGFEMFKNLSTYIYDYCIGDLHDGNLGYRNGLPIIFDYSDYAS